MIEMFLGLFQSLKPVSPFSGTSSAFNNKTVKPHLKDEKGLGLIVPSDPNFLWAVDTFFFQPSDSLITVIDGLIVGGYCIVPTCCLLLVSALFLLY